MKISSLLLLAVAAIVAIVFMRGKGTLPSLGSASASKAAATPPTTAPGATPIPAGASQATALGVAAFNAAPGILDSLSSLLSGSSDDADVVTE